MGEHITGQTELELLFKGQFKGTHINRKHHAPTRSCSNRGDLFTFYLQHPEWGTISQHVCTVSHVIVRNATCISVCIWIMAKHVITSARRLGIHPVLVFKLILQMPSAWHFCEEAGTPSSYRCRKPPHGAEQAQSKKIFQRLIPALLCTVPVSAVSPPQGVLLPVYWQTGGLGWLITAETH